MKPKDKRIYIARKMRNLAQGSNINAEICSTCKKTCCSIGGCGLMSCDVPDMSVEGIKAMLDTGKYSIKFFCATHTGDVVPVLYAREVDSGRINNSIISKRCSLLTETGCSLSEEERPTQAILMIPKMDCKCDVLVSGRDVYFDWIQYSKILDEVVLQETGKTSKELFLEGCREARDIIIKKAENFEELTVQEEQAFQLIDMIFDKIKDDLR